VVSVAGQTLAAMALLIVLVSNLNTARSETIPIPRVLDDHVRPLGLIQNWNVFTDLDNLFFGWYLVLGQTNEGRLVNVLEETDYAGIPIPEHPARAFVNHNQRRFWGQTARPGQEWLRVHLARYLKLRWNERHADPLYHMAIYHIASVPSLAQRRLTVRRLHVQEFPRPDLRDAPPATVQRALDLRREWRQTLEGIPAFVVP
jgi:hypothetical protein